MALSDPSGVLASPLTIIQRIDERQDIKAVIDIVSQYKVGKIIVGLPRSLNGSIGKQAEKIQVFIQNLCKHTEIPVEFRDERLTTVSARRLMKTATKKARVKASDDAIAAALILQGYLDESKA